MDWGWEACWLFFRYDRAAEEVWRLWRYPVHDVEVEIERDRRKSKRFNHFLNEHTDTINEQEQIKREHEHEQIQHVA